MRAALEQAFIQLFHIGPGLDQLGSCQVGVGRGVGKAEAARVGGHAGVQAGRNLRRKLHAHLGDQLGQQLGGCSRVVVHQRFVGVAAVGAVVIDAQVDMLGVILDIIVVAEQLDTSHVHRHHKGGGEAAVVHGDLHVIIHGRNGITAQHSGGLAQVLQCLAQRSARADGIAVRVFVAQNQDVIGAQQARNNGLAVYILSHRVPLFQKILQLRKTLTPRRRPPRPPVRPAAC